MADFNPAYEMVIRNEGGYHDGNMQGIKDTGGETYMGIARNYHPNWGGWALIDNWKRNHVIPYNTKPNIPGLNRVHYDYIKTNFWNKIQGDRIPNQDFANFFFDFYFHKPAPAVKELQKILGVKVDGEFGPKSLAALNSMKLSDVYAAFYNARIAYYRDYGGSFITAFLTRVSKFPEAIYDIVKENPKTSGGIALVGIAALVFFFLNSD